MTKVTELLRTVLTYANKTLPASVTTKIELLLNETPSEDEETRRPYYEKELEHFRQAYARSQERVYELERQVAQLHCRIRENGQGKA